MTQKFYYTFKNILLLSFKIQYPWWKPANADFLMSKSLPLKSVVPLRNNLKTKLQVVLSNWFLCFSSQVYKSPNHGVNNKSDLSMIPEYPQ